MSDATDGAPAENVYSGRVLTGRTVGPGRIKMPVAVEVLSADRHTSAEEGNFVAVLHTLLVEDARSAVRQHTAGGLDLVLVSGVSFGVSGWRRRRRWPRCR